MEQPCWGITAERGFLISPDPLITPQHTPAELLDLAAHTPELLHNRQLRQRLDNLPVYDLDAVLSVDADLRAAERLMQIYGYLASAYVYAVPDDAAKRIPRGVAVPLVSLARRVERPPILSYTGYTLGNWRRIDPSQSIALDNLEPLQLFNGSADERGFILTHVDIEARAGVALDGVRRAADAARNQDVPTVERALADVVHGLDSVIAMFHRMPDQCDTDAYYWQVRPYSFSFSDVIYEGVEAFGGEPQSFRGQTGAQSSVIPALVAALGLRHEQSAMTQHTTIMRQYMPAPHRAFIAEMEQSTIRAFVQSRSESTLREVYNECLRRLLDFRRWHLHIASIYVAQKVANPLGTGGTPFMDWLRQLTDETEAHLLPNLITVPH